MSAKQQIFDICIIGGGPGGYVSAIKAAQLGAKTCLIEKYSCGGICLNSGCIPTKVFLKSIDVLETVRNSTQYGLEGDNSSFTINMKKIQDRKQRVVQEMVDGVNVLLKKNGVEVMIGEGVLVDKNTIMIGDDKINATNIIIATGSSPIMLNVPISEKMTLYKSDEILNLTEIPKTIVVIGGGIIGIELAYFLSKAGSQVTVIESQNRILPMVDSEITEIAVRYIENASVRIFTSAKVTEITENEVLFEKDGRLTRKECEVVLMAVGRKPCFDSIRAKNIGIKIEKGAIVTDDYLRTNIDNIYAVGDVNGKSMLAHTASLEGIVAVENIFSKHSKMNYKWIPNGIYIQPEISTVGMTETQAKNIYGNIKVGRFPMIGNGKAKIEGYGEGLIKLISEAKYGEIVGAHIIAPHATEIITELCTAMNLEGTVDEMVKVIHPHPTISEGILESFYALEGKSIHF